MLFPSRPLESHVTPQSLNLTHRYFNDHRGELGHVTVTPSIEMSQNREMIPMTWSREQMIRNKYVKVKLWDIKSKLSVRSQSYEIENIIY